MIEFDPGDIIDKRYEVIDEIGRGGMGVVLRIKDQTANEEVALKYCPHTDKMLKKRFAREVRIMASIDHAHVMPVLAHNVTNKPPYFVMPVAAGSLEDEVTDNPDVDAALETFKTICLGVQAIHASGSTHRDLKPGNVMRLDDGRIVVSDLGLARLADRDTTTLTQTAAFLGTRMYCAPEQLLMGGSRDADERTDVYQLGKILYELTTGDEPALIDPDLIPGGLMHIIERATQQHPDRRYQTVGQLMDAVQNFIRAQDPQGTAHEGFEAALEQANALIEENRYSTENLEKLLELVIQLGDDDDFYIEQFERFPRRLLRIMADRLPGQLEAPLTRYAEAVQNRIGGYNFEHAETVAKKMRAVFDGADHANMKVLALKATMIAAVSLNRFAAMEVFDNMIMEVRSNELAAPVAEMLRENVDYYRWLAERVPEGKLHAAIRQIEIPED